MSDDKPKKAQDGPRVSFIVENFAAFCGRIRGQRVTSLVGVSVEVSGVPPEDACAIFDSAIETLRGSEMWEVEDGGGPEVGTIARPKGWGAEPGDA